MIEQKQLCHLSSAMLGVICILRKFNKITQKEFEEMYKLIEEYIKNKAHILDLTKEFLTKEG